MKHGIACVAVVLLGVGPLAGQESGSGIMAHWVGAGVDNDWGTAENWLSAGDPAGKDIVFDKVDLVTSKTAVNNVISESITVSSLTFTNVHNEAYHVAQIDPSAVLRVDGASGLAESFRVGARYTKDKKARAVHAYFVGGGAIEVDTPEANVMITTQSIEYTGEAIINMSGLSRFEANVKEFVLGRWQRSSGNFSLAQTNRIEATKVFVSDSHDSDGGESYLRLGRKNEIYTDELYVGAGTGDYNVTGKGTLQFQTLPEGERPSVLIRGKDGVSAVDCTVAFMSSSPGKMNNRQMTAGMNFLGGTVDAKFGKLLVAQHQAYQGSGKTGGATGYISMDAGLVEAENATFGRTIYRSSEAANPARGTLNVLGGTFRAQSLMLAENEGSAGRPYGIVNVAGDGLVEVTGNVMLGKRKGGTTEALAQINLTNGVMRVEGNVEPDVAYKTNIVSEVHLVGGRLEAEEGTLRIERGVLELAAGSAEVGRLVTTNELCRTVVRLSDAGTASVEANESVLLGGTVEVVLEEGFEPLKGTVWQVVTGSAEREGTFAEEVLPELFRVAYTRGGYHVMYDNPATILLVR